MQEKLIEILWIRHGSIATLENSAYCPHDHELKLSDNSNKQLLELQGYL